MRKSLHLILFFLLAAIFLSRNAALAQPVDARPARIAVFIDCSNTWCDMTFIRSEINVVDFSLDNQQADVHVLITSQYSGGGGENFQFIFYGQRQFKGRTDTLTGTVKPNSTDVERREEMIRYLKLGLVPYIARSEAAGDIQIGLRQKKSDSSSAAKAPAKRDPWNYWVMRVGTNGNVNGDAVYKNQRFSGNFSANRTTEELKTGMSFYASAYRNRFEYDDGSGSLLKYTVKNHDWAFNAYWVKSINDHWSWGFEGTQSQNTFSNYKSQTLVRAAVEYNFFKYKEVNNRLFTISYGPTIRHNRYYDTTIYDKTKEWLPGQRADAAITFNQKWGNTSVGINYQSFLTNLGRFNLGIMGSVNVRVTGGLSFHVSVFGGLTRDQVFLQKGDASAEEVLARQRQLASGYNYYTSFGINYRFGSLLNNFVNPRFDGAGSMFF